MISKQAWIDVQDQAPPTDIEILVMSKDEGKDIGTISISDEVFSNKYPSGFKFQDSIGEYSPCDAGFITHWAPLPVFKEK